MEPSENNNSVCRDRKQSFIGQFREVSAQYCVDDE